MSNDISKMDRAELKAVIKSEKLKVRVTTTMSDDDLRKAIESARTAPKEDHKKAAKKPDTKKPDTKKAAKKSEPKSETKKDDGTVVFLSKFPKQWIGDIQFVNGLFMTSDPEKINRIKKNKKFGTSISIQK